MSAFYIDLNTLNAKPITDGNYYLTFSKDKKSLFVTNVTYVSDGPMMTADIKTADTTIKLDGFN